MSILCELFGHKSLEGIYGGAEYMRVSQRAIDGTGRVHYRLIAVCPRCGSEYWNGAVHVLKEDRNPS